MSKAEFNFESVTELRKTLHENPELSDYEFETSKRLIDYIGKFKPDQIIEGLGGAGLAFVFNGKAAGKTIMFRSELDALPIQEVNNFNYKSKLKNVSHKCGHDGHMSIMAAFAEAVSNNRPQTGRVVILFQPAEETGAGAKRVIEDEKFNSIKPDWIFALHNLPGFDKSEIILTNENFASASKGVIIQLHGKTSHAAEPEMGINPAIAVSNLIKGLIDLPTKTKELNNYTLVTLIHVLLGEKAFGTSPGEAEVCATIRSYLNEDMELLTDRILKLVHDVSMNQKLESNVQWVEEFPATINNSIAVDEIIKAASLNNYNYQILEKPFRWSEDFGHFTGEIKGAMFGLGSGKDHPDLHNPDYDFPDEIIETGVNMFFSIYKSLLS